MPIRPLLVLLSLFCMAPSFLSAQSDPMKSLLIEKTGSNHLFHFSNKRGSFYVGETHGYTRHFYMGYISHRENVFNDYQIVLDGMMLDRNETTKVEYLPYILTRKHTNGARTTVFMPDTLDAVVYQVLSSATSQLSFSLYGDAFTEIEEIQREFPSLVKALTNLADNKQVYIAADAPYDHAALVDGKLTVHIQLNKKQVYEPVKIAVGVGRTDEEAKRMAVLALGNYDALVLAKYQRQAQLITHNEFITNDARINKAMQWALISFDNLNMNEVRTGMGAGIYAGYPWFQDYWGRDSFIAIRASTITGQFDVVRENLLSFLKYQIKDKDNPLFGKIPNRVRPDESIYNTADATPRFIIEANRYVQYSKDGRFLHDIFEHLEAAIEGTLKYRVDEEGLLIHADADTWMDAVGPKGPYSPRGNRANDIQALWIQALKSAKLMAAEYGEEGVYLHQISKEALENAERAFQKHFVNKRPTGPVIYDAIKADNEPRTELRVNQIFTVDVLPEEQLKEKVIHQVFNELTTPFGPMSLHKKDEWFHPFHKFEDKYEQDASYHNGIIWVWNTGEVVSQIARRYLPDVVYPITKNYTDILLDHIGLGTLPELTDAKPRISEFEKSYPTPHDFEGISRLDQMSLQNTAKIDETRIPPISGTFSQAWSISEYLRNLIEDYVGMRYDLDDGFSLRPSLPSEWNTLDFRQRFGGIVVEGTIKRVGNGFEYDLGFMPQLPSVPFIYFQDAVMTEAMRLQIGTLPVRYVIKTEQGKLTVLRNNQKADVKAMMQGWAYPNLSTKGEAHGFKFVSTEDIRSDFIQYKSHLD